MKDEMVTLAADRLRALADETRIRMMFQLRRGACNVTQLSGDLGIAQPSVSKHLAILRQVGVVDVEREGNQSVYSIADDSVFGICDLICSGVRRHHEGIARAIGLSTQAPSRPNKARRISG